MDYGFMCSSTLDYSRPQKGRARVVRSYDGFTSYLLIIDEASQYVWVFLTDTKEPPLDIISEFLRHHGHDNGGCIRVKTFSCGNIITHLNPPVRTVHPRMARLKCKMTSLPCELALSYSVQISRLSTGPPRYFTRCTYIIDWFTRKRRQHRLKDIMESNQTLHLLNCLAPEFASNGLAIDAANLTVTTSVAFFSATLQLTKTFFISILTPVW